MFQFMRFLYSCVFYLITPLIIVRLFVKSLTAPAYKKRWLERFGVYSCPAHKETIWLHAVSVGEVEAIFPLIKHLQKLYPSHNLLVTTTTPTGSERVHTVLSDSVSHVYLPYDLPDVIQRFMTHFQPKLAIIVETEIWPNLFAYCANHDIPLYLINARLSQKSTRAYQKLAMLMQPIFAGITYIATQTEPDSQRFIAVGAKSQQVETLGNIKFDLINPEQYLVQGRELKTTFFKQRWVWLCASTHPGEEALCFSSYQALKRHIPELLLVIAPRHPERFSSIKKEAQQLGLHVITRRSGEVCSATTDMFLLDTMGELKMLYYSADCALIGGSFVDIGGHNFLEALIAEVPVVFGSYMDNFKEIAANALTQHAALQCTETSALTDTLLMMYTQPELRKQLSTQGKAFVLHNQGTLAALLKKLSLAIEKIS